MRWAQDLSQQGLERILFLLDLTLEIGDGRCRRADQLLCLPDIEQAGVAARFQSLGELQRLLPGGECALRDFHLQIQRAQLEVAACDVQDEGVHDLALRPLAGQQLRARSLGGAAILSPEVEVPGGGKPDLAKMRNEGAQPAELRRGILLGGVSAAAVDRGELRRARDAELRLRLQDALRGDAHIVILLERGADQILQLWIAKDLPPLLVANRKRSRGCAVRLAGERRAVQIVRRFAGLRVAMDSAPP